jgi:hypothetical protein
MATKLSWVTPPGSLGNFLIGLPASVQLITSDTDYPGTTYTFTKINGDFPPGMTLNSNGLISGTPTYSTPTNNYFDRLDYNFIIRSRSAQGKVVDGNFYISVANIVNNDFQWVTPAGLLATVPNSEFFSLQLNASVPTGQTITYTVISGELPPGMELTRTGTLQGVPTFLNSIAVDQSQNYRFTVRATTNLNHINDRSFSVTLTNVYGPIVEPSAPGVKSLGTFFDGSFYSQQLQVLESNSGVRIQWSIVSGSLPTGVTLSNNGLLSGYIQPLQLVGAWGPAGFDGDVVDSGGVQTDVQDYDFGPYDFNQLNQSLNYSFTVQAYDGANYDIQDYVIQVVSRGGFTADSTNLINDDYLTVDSLNQYLPVLLNTSRVLPTGRQNSYFAFKFDGFDFQGDALTYSLANTVGTFDDDAGFDPLEQLPTNNGLPGSFDSFDPAGGSTNNLPGLLLDASTGWLYGKLNVQTESLTSYTFGVIVSKTIDTIEYASVPIYFTLNVLGDVNNIVEWLTPSNLGSIDNGAVSELSVKAKSIIGKPLVYEIYDQAGLSARLPQGLQLLPSGDISGRVSFEAFTLDNYTTTFDNAHTTIDRTYTFTVLARAEDNSATSIQEFTLTLNIVDAQPYENLYLKAMPANDQRQIYNSIITDTNIFDPAIIYRPTDPWFGVRKNIEMLLLSGLTTKELSDYQQAITYNHWSKRYTFDGVQTAVVLDDYYNVKYEVVYINIVDPSENSSNKGPALTLDLTNTIDNPYIDDQGNQYTVMYPNSTENMIKRLESNIGYADQSSLPPWMASNQPDPTDTAKFKTPLGYTKAVVLAYTVPGAGKLIAYRLKNAGLNFNSIEFTVDRYLVDDTYSKYYDPATAAYIPGKETTFDYLPTRNVGSIVARVNYAVDVPFSEINGRPITYINAAGGIDGVLNYGTGDTMVFAEQEGFSNVGPYDGWVNYFDAYIGDNISTAIIEGYGSTAYDAYTVIPGYLEKVQGTSAVNQRAGVWTINVINGIVYLTPLLEVNPNDRVQILNGKSRASSVLYYDPILSAGQTVPTYKTYLLTKAAVGTPTTFNGGTTKFISRRDQYYAPGSQDKYLKFPQYGVFK